MILFLAGLAVGLLAGALSAAWVQTAKIIVLRERLAAETATKEKLQNEFRLAAIDTLKKTSEDFVASAIKDLRQVKTDADASVQQKKTEIDATVKTIKTDLANYQHIVSDFEKKHTEMHGALSESIKQVLGESQSMRAEASLLKKALTTGSGVRGNFGQMLLEQILEQGGLVKGLNFETQVTLFDDAGNEFRPDFVINLPGGRRLIVDSKATINEYLLAQDAPDPEKQKEHYKNLVSDIRKNFKDLGRKEYQSLLKRDFQFVVMFIPSEAAIREAFMTESGLFQEAKDKQIILASPMTMVPLIQLISHSWQQQKLAENARELGNVVEILGDRLAKFIEHMQKIGGGISKAAGAWNDAVASWQIRVSPQLEKVKSLGGKLKESEELLPIGSTLVQREKKQIEEKGAVLKSPAD